MTESHTCLLLPEFIHDEKNTGDRFQHLLSWFLTICYMVLSMCPVLTPPVFARYFDHSPQVSPEHGEMVTDERRGG